MKQIERIFIGALAAGVWTLIAVQVTSSNQIYAQESSVIEQAQDAKDTQDDTTLIHASDVVGLSSLIDRSIRDHQLRSQSVPSLDQRIKAIVRRCRVSGIVAGDRISSANISC